MMTVTIDINGTVIEKLDVIRIHPRRLKLNHNTLCTYEVQDRSGKKVGLIYGHRYGMGAHVLARRVLLDANRRRLWEPKTSK